LPAITPAARTWQGVIDFEVPEPPDAISIYVNFSGGGEDSLQHQNFSDEWTKFETSRENVARQIAMLHRIKPDEVRWFRDCLLPIYYPDNNDSHSRRLDQIITEANRILPDSQKTGPVPG
jgi:hypothetical protein